MRLESSFLPNKRKRRWIRYTHAAISRVQKIAAVYNVMYLCECDSVTVDDKGVRAQSVEVHQPVVGQLAAGRR